MVAKYSSLNPALYVSTLAQLPKLRSLYFQELTLSGCSSLASHASTSILNFENSLGFDLTTVGSLSNRQHFSSVISCCTSDVITGLSGIHAADKLVSLDLTGNEMTIRGYQ